MSKKSCVALIVAAGVGERCGGDRPKQYQDLAGRPILRRTVEAFLAHPDITGVQVVYNADHAAHYAAALDGLDVPAPIAGGANRQDSVLRGLEHLATAAAPDFVLIHDAARPMVDPGTIARVRAALDETAAAIAAVPVTDTLKRAENGVAVATVERAGLWSAQTPQGFRFPAILAAHRTFAGAGLTDDAAVAERAGLPVSVVQGHVDNIKVTTTDDMTRLSRDLTPTLSDVRTGMGFDVHAFAPGDHVILCGIKIPHSHKLEGHSDADAGFHAITDAILGAIGAGDIGTHFPPSDPQWRGVDSAVFLRHAADLVRQRGGIIASVDVTLICERPKIGPHRPAMTAQLAAVIGIDPERVSVKATTTEQLGFTGRSEGIAAQAIATVRLP